MRKRTDVIDVRLLRRRSGQMFAVVMAAAIATACSHPHPTQVTAVSDTTEVPAPPPVAQPVDLSPLNAKHEMVVRLPSKATSQALLATAHMARSFGDLWDAKALLDRYLALQPNDRDGQLFYAQTLYALTRFDAANAIYSRMRARYPQSIQPYLGLADIALALGNLNASYAWLSRAEANVAPTVENLVPLAQTYVDRARNVDAERVAAQALKFAPEDPQAQWMWAYVLLLRDRSDESEKLTLEIIRRYPDDVQAYRLLARVYMTSSGPRKGIAAVRDNLLKAEALASTDSEVYREAGEVYQRRGLYHAAAQEYARMLDLRPDSPEGRYGLGHLYALLGRMDLSHEQLRLYELFSKRAKQLNSLHEEVDKRPTDSARHLRYGRFLESLGKYADALQEYQIAGSLAPGSADARRALSALYARFGWGEPGNPA